MSVIVDHLISEPGAYFYVNPRGKLAARIPALLGALTPTELAELKSFAEALVFILREERTTSPVARLPDGQNPGGTGPSPARTASHSTPGERFDAPDPAPEPPRRRPSTSDPGGNQHRDIWEVVVAPRAGGGPHQIVTRRTRDEVRERTRRESGSVFRYR